MYESKVFVATECPTHGFPIYSAIGDDLSPPLASLQKGTVSRKDVLASRFKITNSRDLSRAIPVNGEHCSKCSAVKEVIKHSVLAAAPVQRLKAFQEQQFKAYQKQRRYQQQQLDISFADNFIADPDPSINKYSSSCRAPNSTETVPALKRIKLFYSRKP